MEVEPSYEQIATRAYFIALERGFQTDPLSDWLLAERELRTSARRLIGGPFQDPLPRALISFVGARRTDACSFALARRRSRGSAHAGVDGRSAVARRGSGLRAEI